MSAFKEGDRIKRSDADTPREDGSMPIPGYRAMRGTVTGMGTGYWKNYVLVQWDCDPPGEWTGSPHPSRGPTPTPEAWIALVKDGDGKKTDALV